MKTYRWEVRPRGDALISISLRWAIPGLFFFIFVFSNLRLADKTLPMSGFELRISGVGSNRSTNWATTTALPIIVSTHWHHSFWTNDDLPKWHLSMKFKKILSNGLRYPNHWKLTRSHVAPHGPLAAVILIAQKWTWKKLLECIWKTLLFNSFW